MSELRLLASITVLLALVMVAGLVSMHEKHYAKRRLTLLEARLSAVERILTEDRTV